MGKNIVICCDGTNNEITGDSTNVLRLFQMLSRDERQVAYYDAGVGTTIDPAAVTRWRKILSRTIDGMLGLSVRENVVEAYRFLVREYAPGDNVYLFGFSRGAYTVRALAGMIHFLGLLRPELEGLANLGWTVYADDDETLPVARRFRGGGRFREAFARRDFDKIHFVGVWDTVSAFGFFWNLRGLPSTASNPSIRHVRHACAIDERRGLFRANIFRPRERDQHLSIKEVWFAGVHSDVGGGYKEKPDEGETKPQDGRLSYIPLRWMLREARKVGLLVNDKADTEFERPDGAYSSQEPGMFHESLRGFWHLGELLPRRSFDNKTKKMRWKAPNFWRRRELKSEIEQVRVHQSVFDRQDYRPPNLPTDYTIEP